MPSPPPNNIDVPFPLSGIDVSGEYGVQRPGTTAKAKNVRANDPILERNRGGSRHGMIKYPAEQIPEGSTPFQNLAQLVLLDAAYLLAAFQDLQTTFVPDTSTNNNSTRNPPGRLIPVNGSGVPPNRNYPLDPRREIAVVVSQATQVDGQSVTITGTLTKQSADTDVSGATLTLFTIPRGRNGDGMTTTTNGSGIGTFTVSEATFEGTVIYLVANEYDTP